MMNSFDKSLNRTLILRSLQRTVYCVYWNDIKDYFRIKEKIIVFKNKKDIPDYVLDEHTFIKTHKYNKYKHIYF